MKYNNYTSLNTAQTNILMETRDKQYMNWLGKLRGNPKIRDRRKYYRFYCDYGHNIEDYKTLKDEIEYLIRRGYLNRFKKETRVKQSDE